MINKILKTLNNLKQVGNNRITIKPKNSNMQFEIQPVQLKTKTSYECWIYDGNMYKETNLNFICSYIQEVDDEYQMEIENEVDDEYQMEIENEVEVE